MTLAKTTDLTMRAQDFDSQNIRITFGMIVLNAEPFLRYNLRALYPFAHQIVVVEGAALAGRAVATADGHSTDSTLSTLREFKANDDPEGKLMIVTAEDTGHPTGFWEEKGEMSAAYASRATGNYLWQIDADEFYRPEDMRAVIDMLAADRRVTAVSFRMHTFWGAPGYLVDSYFLRKFVAHRLFSWGEGYRYVTHRPPTVVDGLGRDVRTLMSVSADEMAAKGILLYHYELLFPKQVADKAQYYASVGWTSEFRRAREWVDTCYMRITRPFRVHMEYDHISWLERFNASPPPQVALMMRDVAADLHTGVQARRTDDVESLLNDKLYTFSRWLLRLMIPVDKHFTAARMASRRILGPTGVWRVLRYARRIFTRGSLEP